MAAAVAITDPRILKRIYDRIVNQAQEDIFLVLLTTGAHVSVVADPQAHNAMFDGRVLTWHRPKTNRLIRIVVPEPGHMVPATDSRIKEAISRWLEPRNRLMGIYPTSRFTIDHWARKWGRRAKYKRPLSPGTFRHTFCYWDLYAHKDMLRTMSKMGCTMRMITDNYGLLGVDL